ncbi:ATP-binding protein [Leptospira gomenensis]|uniref:ATP-binding protein n=1 Tax=Leptospira gomenensis TaxID=2484974 RepID=A0A5F1YA15_9LEPT|nr:ATP-binding protein [Leptospira gomenensis]TGK33427.1 ATP-binding protein [Leptospira gomenensis]TGK40949.1 ATP-binding protein [Leptospira gomenensis]TGK46381.1 ATP-binding protein [Leptospira gomenensis]TGK67483.1 ATP-binding protein [Leptospira gomenensis]
MDPKSQRIHTFPNDLSELAKVREEVRSFLGNDCEDILRGRLVFAIDEALTNVIEHGFPDQRVSQVELKMIRNKNFLRFTITDDGIPFDPTLKKSDTWKELFETGADGGFGLRSLKKIMTVRYKRLQRPARNRLTLIHPRKENDSR